MCICDKLCPAVRRGIGIEFFQQNYEIEKVTEVYSSFFSYTFPPRPSTM